MTELNSFYTNSREHLYDELAKLDALIHLQVLRFRALNPGACEGGYSSLFIKEEDVDRLITGKSKDGDKNGDVKGINAVLNMVDSLGEQVMYKANGSIDKGVYLPLFHLAEMFQLSPLERDIILVCLALELDTKYEKLFAYLQDDVTKKLPSVNLILDLLCLKHEDRIDARTCFFQRSPLLKYRLLHFSDHSETCPLISRCVKLDDRIVNFLLEQDQIDSQAAAIVNNVIYPTRDWSSLVMDQNLTRRLNRLKETVFKKGRRDGVILYLKGPYGVGKKSTAEAFCHNMELPLMVVDTGDLRNLEPRGYITETLERLFREALLYPAAIYFDRFDCLETGTEAGAVGENDIGHTVVRVAAGFPVITFAGEADWKLPPGLKKNGVHNIMEIQLPEPLYGLRKQLWASALKDIGTPREKIDLDEIAGKFRFTAGQIRDAAAGAKQEAALREGHCSEQGLTMADLYRGCLAQSNHHLSRMARKIIPQRTWSDIVLPPDKMQQLKEMCNYVKYRFQVYNHWGFGSKFSLGKGLNILFSGPSGTGKTMAAEIIAHELGLEFYKLDLSCVVSKYIGETEKNLARIFKEAEAANAVLFFDEADALFGKRSEVKDSHDRYANIEINYLLQKMEEHEGIVILATNFRRNMDDAFTRRMHFSLDFPFPDEKYRLHIWKKVFPSQSPRDRDINFNFLAEQFKIPGGGIKNIALSSAFLAADNSGKINMKHIVHATKREYQKMGRMCSEGDFKQYFSLVKEV